jgi:hypothetical protein
MYKKYFSVTKTIHSKTKGESILETSYRAVQIILQDKLLLENQMNILL